MAKNLNTIDLDVGSQVSYRGKNYTIKQSVDLQSVVLEDDKKIITVANIGELYQPVNADNNANEFFDFSSIPKNQWEQAIQRYEAINPLAKQRNMNIKDVSHAANLLKLSTRHLYFLINCYKESGFEFKSLLPQKRTGGKGKGRLSYAVEKIIDDCINELYLTKQKHQISTVIEEIYHRCRLAGLKTPSEFAIRYRIKQLSSREVIQKREGARIANHECNAIPGRTPEANFPLSVFQIDHTKVDVIIVDEKFRQPIGRPYLTVAIDVFSRCIAGFCLTLEPPSAVSVGLCVTHAIFDKESWLEKRDIQAEWFIWGKPDLIYVDNAAEFHSEALSRGCKFHEIKLEYRPIGGTHFGGIVERVIGTLMQLIHQLPGTTFSSVQDRNDYDSEKKAVLTLAELEKWLTIAITDYYHQKYHQTIMSPPILKFREGILGEGSIEGRGYPPKIKNEKAFLIDFLPIEKRMLRREGLILDGINYFSNSLKPLIADRKKFGKLLLRRDPRDISKIYLLDPKSDRYIEVPYRNISRPTISLWEHKNARKWLKEKGVEKIDEDKIFKAIQQMREIVKKSSKMTKQQRKDNERRKQNEAASKKTYSHIKPNDCKVTLDIKNIKPFEEIESW